MSCFREAEGEANNKHKELAKNELNSQYSQQNQRKS